MLIDTSTSWSPAVRPQPVVMRIVAALGGHGLPRESARIAAAALGPIAATHELIVTHGNGRTDGHLIQAELGAQVGRHGVATIVTQAVVPADDRAELPELRTIEALIAAEIVPICAGPGVGEGDNAALLADRLDADLLLLLTNASTVDDPDHTAAAEAAAARFAAAPGRRAVIGRVDAVADLVAGRAGRQVVPRSSRCGGCHGACRS